MWVSARGPPGSRCREAVLVWFFSGYRGDVSYLSWSFGVLLVLAVGACSWWNSQSGLSIKHLPAINHSPISHPQRGQKMISAMNCVGLRWAVHLGCWLGKSWNSCRGSGCRRAMAEASPEPLVHFSWVFHRKAFADCRPHCGNPCLRSSFSEICAHVQAVFRESKPTSVIMEAGAEYTEHRLGDRAGFISTYTLLTLVTWLNFLEPWFHHL